MTTRTIRAVLFREGEWWVAQCLEFDLATQARTLKDLHYELEKLLIGQLVAGEASGREPFKGLPKAPAKYWDLWEEAGSTVAPRTRSFDEHSLRSSPPRLELRAAA